MWSARDLQPLLGYAKWQRFENALKKAIESCKISGNNPDHHFTGSGKQIEFGKGATQTIAGEEQRRIKKLAEKTNLWLLQVL